MSFVRGLVPVFAAALLSLPVSAQAGELDSCRLQTRGTGPQVAQAELGYEFEALRDEVRLHSSEIDRVLAEDIRLGLDTVPMRDLRNVEDFHPETDRWTEHNNRIRITWFNGAWFFSNELDIEATWVSGLRLAWEVPGFIGIRIDSAFAPLADLEVRGGVGGGGNRRTETVRGLVHSHTLSLGIFNPELSVDGLAFWAGFGAGLWIFNFNENDVFGAGTGDVDFTETNLSGNIFIELDYKIADIFHVGIGIRQHFLLADHTDDSAFPFDIAGTSTTDGRNDGILDDLAGVTEFTFNLSVLF